MINIKIFKIITLYLTCFSSLVSGQETSAAFLKQFAEAYILEQLDVPQNSQLEVKASTIDPRIEILPCLSPLQAKLPEKHNNRNISLKITCTDEQSWHQYLSVRVKIMLPVVITSISIAKGDVLDHSNLTISYKEERNFRGKHLTSIEQIKGAKAKRNISKNSMLTKHNICLVCKGESVTIIAQSNNFMIKTLGTATSNGSIGEQIKVKNTKSGRTISATILAKNKVLVSL